jgi:RimJ/RimL family protein N-acetyltransferase
LDHLREIDKVELRYDFLREYWGKGYGTEAAKAVVRYAFYKMGIPELYAAVHPENIASERIIKRIGMTYLKKMDWPDKKQVHIYLLSNPSISNE